MKGKRDIVAGQECPGSQDGDRSVPAPNGRLALHSVRICFGYVYRNRDAPNSSNNETNCKFRIVWAHSAE